MKRLVAWLDVPGRRVLAVGLLWGVLIGVLCFRFQSAAPDDMYISYRYARNLAAGEGFTFNPGEAVYGISDPGVALLLAGASAATGFEIPLLGTVLTGISLLAAAMVVLVAASKNGRLWEAAGGGTLALTSTFLWLGQGSGPLVALALLLLASNLVERHPLWAGALAGFAVWCRPESLIGCGLLALAAWKWPRAALAFASIVAALCALGAALGWWYFGQPLPGTLAVKRQFAALAPEVFTGWNGFWKIGIEQFVLFEGLAGKAMLGLGLIGVAPLLRRMGLSGWVLTAYCAAQVILYSVLEVPFFIWYVAPAAFLVLVASGFAVGELARMVGARFGNRSVPATAVVAIVLAAAIALPALTARLNWFRDGGARDWRAAAYPAAGRWLAANTPEDSGVAFDEVGLLGFHSGRRILDLVGLESPGVVPYAAVNDQVGAFLAAPTSHVLFHTFDVRGGTRPIVSRPWFASAYREVARLDFPDHGGAAVIYERLAGAVLPPARPPFDKQLVGPAAAPTGNSE